MNKNNQLVIFILNEQRYALYLQVVERIVPAVEITPLPKAPNVVSGIINVQGIIIPVFNIRKHFCLPEKELSLTDQFIIAKTSKRKIAVVTDSVTGVIKLSGNEVIPKEEILPGLEYIEGVVKLEDGLILIHNLDRFLSIEEDNSISETI